MSVDGQGLAELLVKELLLYFLVMLKIIQGGLLCRAAIF